LVLQLAGSVCCGLVGIFAAFIITKIINNQTEFQRKNSRLRELLTLSAKYRDALLNRSFDWFNERMKANEHEQRTWSDAQSNEQ